MAAFQHTLFDVFPERYNGEIIGLSDIIQGAMAYAQANGQDISGIIAQTMLKALQHAMGSSLPVPLEVMLPLLTGGKQITPQQVMQGFRLISAHSIISNFEAKHEFREKAAPRPSKETPWLVDSPFRVDGLADFVAAHSEALHKSLFIPPLHPVDPEHLPGLMLGSQRPWVLPEAEGLNSVVFADVLSRLMFNYSAFPESPLQQRLQEADDIFFVEINGKSVSRIDDFLNELAARPGASLSGGILKAAATFGTLLSFKDPRHPDAPVLDVPFTLFLNTGIVCRETGKTVHVPMTHSGLFLKYRSPEFSFEVEFYLGSGGNAKFRSGNRRTAAWYQPSTTSTFITQAELTRAVVAASLYANFIDSLAVELRLVNGGYGANGICADSVAPIEKLITGSCSVYPVLGFISNKIILLKRLREAASLFSQFLAAGPHPVLSQLDADLCNELAKTISTLPSDGGIPLDQYVDCLHRMRSTIPWATDRIPFRGAENAARILEAEIEHHRAFLG